jgi:hypothetical protein
VPTPGELNKIKSAVAKAAADLLARDDNAEKSAEDIALEISEAVTEAVVTTYEEIQAKSYNLVVVASFKLPDGTVHTAAVGPLSTRAKQRAREFGERFAWDYKTRTGTGMYSLVPLIRNPAEAWDEARAQEIHALMPAVLRGALSSDPFGPACTCGLDTSLLQEQGKYFLCPRHPEESDGREDPAGDHQHPAPGADQDHG